MPRERTQRPHTGTSIARNFCSTAEIGQIIMKPGRDPLWRPNLAQQLHRAFLGTAGPRS